MKYSDSQIWTIGRSMKSGLHGSFAAHIGEALMVADIGNRETLLKAFESLFDRVARFNDVEHEKQSFRLSHSHCIGFSPLRGFAGLL